MKESVPCRLCGLPVVWKIVDYYEVRAPHLVDAESGNIHECEGTGPRRRPARPKTESATTGSTTRDQQAAHAERKGPFTVRRLRFCEACRARILQGDPEVDAFAEPETPRE